MAYAGATYADVRAFDGPAFAFADFRRAVLKPLAIGFAAVAAALALCAAIIFGASWILGAVVSTNPHFHGRMPLTPELRALTGRAHLRLNGTAQFAGAAPAMTRTAYARDLALQAELHRALAAARAAKRAVARADRVPLPPKSVIARVDIVPAQPAPPPKLAIAPVETVPAQPAPLPTKMQVAKLAPVPAPAVAPAPEGDTDKVPLPPRRPADVPPIAATREIARATAERAAPELTTASLPPPDSQKQPTPRQEAIDNSRTAYYDIAAHTVYMPDGERLEAHSGIGFRRDNPRYVDRRNRGPTPPNTYELSLRERLFHGVRAIRLTPLDEDKMYGRDGMLAHTYMLGRSGQSNGCVSFRNYRKFLRAFLKGKVERLVVVPRLTGKLARAVLRRGGRNERYALND